VKETNKENEEVNYYIVTIVSPSGFRDTFGVHAPNEEFAIRDVQAKMVATHPLWTMKSIRRA
jgi:hypothetical protein